MGSFSLAATDDVSIASGYFCLAANSLHAYFCTSSYSSWDHLDSWNPMQGAPVTFVNSFVPASIDTDKWVWQGGWNINIES